MGGWVIYRLILTASRIMAWLGGAMLCALVLLTCISVAGRALNGFLHDDLMSNLAPGVAAWFLDLGIGAINGDFELIEAGIAFAIFAFLPLCHLTGGHATVDIFTSRMSARTNRSLAALTALIFAGVLVLIAVQLFSGMQSKIRSGQTTFLLEFPVWWAYALCQIGATLAAIVALYLALIRLAELARNRDLLPAESGAEH